MLNTLLSIVHVSACIFLILVVLLQQGKSGGLGSAFGGGASQQVFGGRGAGNLLTRLTSVFAAVFMLTSLSLAYLASAGDIKLKAKAASATAPLPTTLLTTPTPSAPPPPSSAAAPPSAAPDSSAAPASSEH
jgi:preprotein translocase subunit SecG